MRSQQDLIAIFSGICKDIELFLKLKNFIKELNNRSNDNQAIDDLNSLIDGERSLADLFGTFLSNNPKMGFKLIPNYLLLERDSENINFTPIEAFLNRDDAWLIFNENKNFVVEELYPLTFINTIYHGFINIGLTIMSRDFRGSISNVIEITIRNKTPILAPIDNKLNNKLIAEYVEETGLSPCPVDRDPITQAQLFCETLKGENNIVVPA